MFDFLSVAAVEDRTSGCQLSEHSYSSASHSLTDVSLGGLWGSSGGSIICLFQVGDRDTAMPSYIARETRPTARERTDGLECRPAGSRPSSVLRSSVSLCVQRCRDKPRVLVELRRCQWVRCGTLLPRKYDRQCAWVQHVADIDSAAEFLSAMYCTVAHWHTQRPAVIRCLASSPTRKVPSVTCATDWSLVGKLFTRDRGGKCRISSFLLLGSGPTYSKLYCMGRAGLRKQGLSCMHRGHDESGLGRGHGTSGHGR